MYRHGTSESMTRTHLIVLGLVVLATIGFLAVRSHTNTLNPPLTSSVSIREAYWKGRIGAVGPTRAYQEFADAVAHLSPAKQHENAHAFGGALFEVSGTAGLSTCDARFSYGCFHEFLGRAIAALGLSIVNSLNQGCVDSMKGNALSCQHGIGHGIQASLGYDEAALKKALGICKDLPYNDPIGGCYGGVFMEYNMQTMLGEQARTRPMKEGDPLYPCDTLDKAYVPACAFWSPQWWIDLQHQSGTTIDMRKVGALCDSFTDAAVIRSCYEGLGTVVPPEAHFDAVNVRMLCDASSPDQKRELYCLSYAANSLDVGGSGQVGDAKAVCDGLSAAAHDYCIAYAENKANLAVPLTDI